MASDDKATDDEAVVFGDEFVADEILARLPARCAARCTVLSKHFRQLIVSSHFWLLQRRLGAPLELPHAVRLQRHDDCKAFYFHVVGPKFVMEHTVNVEHQSWYASTCNGLVVLVSGISYPDKGQSSVNGIVFNPATREEARLSLPLPHTQNKGVERRIFGFGYGPSSKVYKALVHEAHDHSIRLMVVSLDGSGGQEPRTVFSSDEPFYSDHNLQTADGKVYFLIYAMDIFENWYLSVLAFDVDSEAVTRIAIPEQEDIAYQMLKVHGRPCIYTQEGQKDTVIWLLNTDHQWEKFILVKEHRRDDWLMGVWDCGDGLLFTRFIHSGAYMYNLYEAPGEKNEGRSGNRLTAVSSLKIEDKWLWKNCWSNIWDYQPTLISPSSIFGDAAFLGHGRESVAPKHELDGTFLKMTQKWVVDPMMHMLSALRPPSG